MSEKKPALSLSLSKAEGWKEEIDKLMDDAFNRATEAVRVKKRDITFQTSDAKKGSEEGEDFRFARICKALSTGNWDAAKHEVEVCKALSGDVDSLGDFWLTVQARFSQVKTLLLNQDNGPENNSRRSQFVKRITEFADKSQVTIQLAYYPPYHSKYNPTEHVWGVLERMFHPNFGDNSQKRM
jgi:hypothetical protein